MIVEFIESYRKVEGSDYQYNDNHGILVRCKDCKYQYIDEKTMVCGQRGFFVSEDFYCADGERREENETD